MSKKNAIIAFFLLSLVIFVPIKSFAVTNDFEDSEMFNEDSAKILIKEAKVIIKGEVKNVKYSRGINDVVYTKASILVDEIIKGKVAKKNITVEYREGKADDFGLFTEENPSLEQEEKVILFLTNSFWRKNIYYIVGGASGKYAVCANDTVKVGSSCDSKGETEIIDEESQDQKSIFGEEEVKTETKITEGKKQTLEELLGEIKDAK